MLMRVYIAVCYNSHIEVIDAQLHFFCQLGPSRLRAPGQGKPLHIPFGSYKSHLQLLIVAAPPVLHTHNQLWLSRGTAVAERANACHLFLYAQPSRDS